MDGSSSRPQLEVDGIGATEKFSAAWGTPELWEAQLAILNTHIPSKNRANVLFCSQPGSQKIGHPFVAMLGTIHLGQFW